MAIRSSFLIGVFALGGLAACASIVGLDSADPSPGPAAGEGTSSSGGGNGLDGGPATEAGVSVSEDSFVFERAPCNIQQTKEFRVRNQTSAPVAVEVTIPANENFSLADATDGAVRLELAPRRDGSFVVQARSSVGGSSSADVKLKIGDEERQVNVSLETVGGKLSFDRTELDFGQIRTNTASEKQKVVFRNEGNDAINVAGFANAANFQFLGLPFKLEAGATIEKEVQMNAGAQSEPIAERAAAQVEGLCGEAPSLTLKGQRLDAPYTINPRNIDFGDVNCGGASPGARSVTISNYTSSPKAFTFALGKSPSPFTATATTSTVGAGSTSSPATSAITIGFPTVGDVPSELTDNLTVTVDGAAVTIPLRARVRGALLEVSATTLRLNRSNGSSGIGKVSLTNRGNVTACVRYVRTNDTFLSEDYSCAFGSCAVTDDNDQVNAGQSTDWSVRYFSGSGSTTITANIARCGGFGGQTAPLCGAAPKVTVTPNN